MLASKYSYQKKKQTPSPTQDASSISEEEIHTGYASSEKGEQATETNIYKIGISAFSTASKEKKTPKRKRSEKSSKKKSIIKSRMSSISEKSVISEVFSTTTEEIMTEMTANDYIFPLDSDGDELDTYNFDAFKERKDHKRSKWWE